MCTDIFQVSENVQFWSAMTRSFVPIDRQTDGVTLKWCASQCNSSIAAVGVVSVGLCVVALTNDPLVCVEFGAVIERQHTDTLYRVAQKPTRQHVKQSV